MSRSLSTYASACRRPSAARAPRCSPSSVRSLSSREIDRRASLCSAADEREPAASRSNAGCQPPRAVSVASSRRAACRRRRRPRTRSCSTIDDLVGAGPEMRAHVRGASGFDRGADRAARESTMATPSWPLASSRSPASEPLTTSIVVEPVRARRPARRRACHQCSVAVVIADDEVLAVGGQRGDAPARDHAALARPAALGDRDHLAQRRRVGAAPQRLGEVRERGDARGRR